MRTEEVDAERADYLRYLSVVRDNVRAHAAEQRAALEWSHPEPELLAAVPGTRRQWERDPHDPDFLVVRAGLHDAPLNTTLRVKDTADEIDLEPVSHSTLRGLLDVQRTVRIGACRASTSTKVSRITVLGEPDEVRGALRAWIAQAVTWHDPAVLGVALAAPDLEGDDWSWLKWLPHNDIPGEVDGVGPARYLAEHRRRPARAAGAGARRPGRLRIRRRARGQHLLIVLDDPEADPSAVVPSAGARRRDARAPVAPKSRTASSIRIPSGPSCGSPTAGSSAGRRAAGSPTSTPPTSLASRDARHLARRLSRWDSNPSQARTAATGVADLHHAARHPGRRRTRRRRACGRRATATTNCGCPSASPPPVNR